MSTVYTLPFSSSDPAAASAPAPASASAPAPAPASASVSAPASAPASASAPTPAANSRPDETGAQADDENEEADEDEGAASDASHPSNASHRSGASSSGSRGRGRGRGGARRAFSVKSAGQPDDGYERNRTRRETYPKSLPIKTFSMASKEQDFDLWIKQFEDAIFRSMNPHSRGRHYTLCKEWLSGSLETDAYDIWQGSVNRKGNWEEPS